MVAALSIVRKGLKELPRYGPLWFGLLRICETKDTNDEINSWIKGSIPIMPRVITESDIAIHSISKELIWKIHFEVACIFERANDVTSAGLFCKTNKNHLERIRSHLYDRVRISYLRSLLSCPPNLRWKVLLVAARLELLCSEFDRSRILLNRAWIEVPEKSKAAVFLECSRFEEYAGNISLAREIISKAKFEMRSDWKVFMEAVQVELRQGNLKEAVSVGRDALSVHPGAGRLWSLLIQLSHRCECLNFDVKIVDLPSKYDVLLHALSRCPKSGEIWCEAARIHLNPLIPDSFDLTLAQRYLGFAAQFTPQYGDTFIEILRVEFIIRAILLRTLNSLGIDKETFVGLFLSEDLESDAYDMAWNVAETPVEDPFYEWITTYDWSSFDNSLDKCDIDVEAMVPSGLKTLNLR